MAFDRTPISPLDALAAVRLDWAATPDDVWDPRALHVDGVHEEAERALLDGMEDAWRSPGRSPLGLVIEGSKGVGKTHLLGWMRRQVQRGGGYFFLVQYLAGDEFWRAVVQGILDGLLRPVPGAVDQLCLALGRLGDRMDADRRLEAMLAGDRSATRDRLDAFVAGVRSLDRQVAVETQDVARALVLYASPDWAQNEVARAFLGHGDEVDPIDRAAWGLERSSRPAHLVVRDVTRILALTGEPTVLAVDQLDTLIAQSRPAHSDGVDPAAPPDVLDAVADGLISLREITRRALTVLSVLPESWELIRVRQAATVSDRFRRVRLRDVLPDPVTATDLVVAHLGSRYAGVGFDPPHPTWPVSTRALAASPTYTARQLLQRVDAHARRCLAVGQVLELEDLTTDTPAPPAARPEAGRLRELDADFARRRSQARPAALLDPATEDTVLPELLRAGLTCLVHETPREGDLWELDPPPSSRRPPLHARLRLVLDPATEDERHWAFRGVLGSHPRAVQTRLMDARLASGISPRIAKRRLFLLRNDPWPQGPRTSEIVAELLADGAVQLRLGESDLRTLEALRGLLAADPPGLQGWLAARAPASATDLLRSALAPQRPSTATG